jgi:hypothetical protein
MSGPEGTREHLLQHIKQLEMRLEEAESTTIPAEPSAPVITASAALAFRKHQCENTL